MQNNNTNDEQEIQEEGSESLDTKLNSTYSDDVHFEEDEVSENPALEIKKLRERLRICEKEKKENLDGWQRVRADFANARKEEESRRGDMIKFASEGFVDDLLPVLDSFSMAFSNKEAWEKVDANWRKGVEYIYAQLYSTLESRGVTEIGKPGESFDPRLHVALEEVPAPDQSQADTVAEIIQKGYRLHNKVIRPAKVKVFGHLN